MDVRFVPFGANQDQLEAKSDIADHKTYSAGFFIL